MALTFIFPVGLPGSGKTTYLKNLATNVSMWNTVEYFDADKGFSSIDELVNALDKKYNKKYPTDYSPIILVDGLFISNEVHKKIIESIDKKIKYASRKFIVFNGDKETLLFNDAKRFNSGERAKNTAISIKNLKMETNYIRENKLIKEEIKVEKFNYLYNLRKSLDVGDIISSSQWSTGGTYGTCWDEDGPTEVYPDEPLKINRHDFWELFSVLDKLYKFKSEKEVDLISYIYEDLADIEEEDESDYYGGCQTHDRYKIYTSEIIRLFHKDKYGIEGEDFNSAYIEENFPEIFI